MNQPTVVLATNNAGKLAELRRLMAEAGLPIQVLGLADLPAYPEPAETGRSFEDNALIKAREAATRSGLPSLADDSGLEVAVLNDMPGVRSARWSGAHGDDAANTALLLAQISDVPAGERDARFVSAVALVVPQPDGGVREQVLRRDWAGQLIEAPRGSNGFGYDPIFVPAGQELTSAELSPAAKDAASHRGQAVRAMIPLVAAELGVR